MLRINDNQQTKVLGHQSCYSIVDSIDISSSIKYVSLYLQVICNISVTTCHTSFMKADVSIPPKDESTEIIMGVHLSLCDVTTVYGGCPLHSYAPLSPLMHTHNIAMLRMRQKILLIFLPLSYDDKHTYMEMSSWGN